MSENIELNFVSQNVQSRIPEGAVIQGDYKCSTGLLVEGTINGGLISVHNGPLVVMEGGEVNGRIHVKGDLFVLGSIKGENAIVEGVVTVSRTGRIIGSMKADDYKTYAGAILNGTFGQRD